MRHVVRGLTLLLFLALAACWLLLRQRQFLLAGVSIVFLVELALSLRAAARTPPAPRDRSRLHAARVTWSEQDGTLTVKLTGQDEGPAGAACVLLSRGPRAQPPGSDEGDGPYLELSDPRGSVRGGIVAAYLSPQLLRLTLDPRGTELLGVDAVCATLAEGIDRRRLERSLSRILRGVPFTSERSMPAMDELGPAGVEAAGARAD